MNVEVEGEKVLSDKENSCCACKHRRGGGRKQGQQLKRTDVEIEMTETELV